MFRTNHQSIISRQPAPNAYDMWLKARFKEQQSCISKDTQEAVELLSRQINSWGSVPFLEIEARLGYFDDDDDGNVKLPFDSNVDKENFDKIKKALSEYPDIRNVTESSSVIYVFDDDIRMEVTSDGSRSAIQKKKLEHSNFRYDNSPFDVRVSFCTEVPVALETIANKKERSQRKKSRTTYHTNHWKFDMTVVSYADNGIEKREYQVEVEANLDVIPYSDYVYMADSMMMKIKMLVNHCEKEECERDMVPLNTISRKFEKAENIENQLRMLKI